MLKLKKMLVSRQKVINKQLRLIKKLLVMINNKRPKLPSNNKLLRKDRLLKLKPKKVRLKFKKKPRPPRSRLSNQNQRLLLLSHFQIPQLPNKLLPLLLLLRSCIQMSLK